MGQARKTWWGSVRLGRLMGLVLFALVVAAAGCADDPLYQRPAFLTASTDLINFGEQDVGTDTMRTLFLLNKGDLPLTLSPPEGDLLGGVFSGRWLPCGGVQQLARTIP